MLLSQWCFVFTWLMLADVLRPFAHESIHLSAEKTILRTICEHYAKQHKNTQWRNQVGASAIMCPFSYFIAFLSTNVTGFLLLERN